MDERKIAMRLTNTRAHILKTRPFFGRLLMSLPIGFSDCGSACTDMKSIMFDPAFVELLTDEELTFVYMHELMHCVLKHCTRGKGKLQTIYNIACDIVVNSVILEAMGLDEMTVAGQKVMHKAPNGKEGREYTAEQLYTMFMKIASGKSGNGNGNSGSDDGSGNGNGDGENKDGSGETEDGDGAPCNDGFSDSHKVWQEIKPDSSTESVWDAKVAEASRAAGSLSGIPDGINRIITDAKRNARIDWRYLLHALIKKNRHGYDYYRPDRRFSTPDVILPTYTRNLRGSHIDKIWFLADTSGSVSDNTLATVISEVKNLLEQIESVEGLFSCFDSSVTVPEPFESIEDFEKIPIKGGGGTSFKAIFNYMKLFFTEELPKTVIIITDGYATFPNAEEMLGVDVIWIIADSEVVPPHGEYIHIFSEEEG